MTKEERSEVLHSIMKEEGKRPYTWKSYSDRDQEESCACDAKDKFHRDVTKMSLNGLCNSAFDELVFALS